MKKLLAILLALAMVCALAPLVLASEAVITEEEPVVIDEPAAPALDGGGPVGDTLQWEIRDGDDALYIAGTGPMYDFGTDEEHESPFTLFLDYDITFRKAVIGGGVTTVGANLLRGCGRVEEITVPATVTRIGQGAFDGTSLKDIFYTGSEAQWKAVAVQAQLGGAVVHYNCEPVDVHIDYGDPVTRLTPTEDLWTSVDTDPKTFSFRYGADGSKVAIVHGEDMTCEAYYTLATGAYGGDYRVKFDVDSGEYVFSAQPNAVYLIKYYYGYRSSSSDDETTTTVTGPGGTLSATMKQVRGSLRGGDLAGVYLIARDADAPVPFTPPPVTPAPTPVPTPAPTPVPAKASVKISDDAKTAKAEGFDGLYARVALVLDNGGVSGLYVTQATINADGTIVIPAFQVPGLSVKGVNIALVPTIEDIQKPAPTVSAADFRML